MKNLLSSSARKYFYSCLLFIFAVSVSFAQQKRMTCIDSLLTNPEYGNNKNFMNELNTKRKQGFSDKQIYDEYSAEEAKRVKAYMDAANEQFVKKYIIPNSKNVSRKILSPNSYYCHADSLGLLSASSMGNWKGYTMGWANTGLCSTAPWTQVLLPCNSCTGNASGGVDNISIAPPPASEPCANIPGFPINLPSPYGGSQTIQLGNNNVNAQSERISYTFIVKPTDVSFNYQYASVLENPSHIPANQPFFDFVILDQNGDTVPCSFQHYISAPNLPGWQTTNFPNAACAPYSGNTVYYKPWAVVGVNLSGYIGQPVTVVCTVADCSQCGHFGLTYIDFACTSLNTGQFCIGDTSTMLTAPYDPSFSYNWSNGATTDTIVVNPNNYLPPNDTIRVHVSQSSSSCPFDFAYVLAPTHIFPGFSDSIHCNKVYFTDTTLITSGTISSWNWSFPGGNPSSSTSQNPGPITYSPGTYTVNLHVTSLASCKDSVIGIPITILPPPVITVPNAALCGGQSITLCASGAGSGGTYVWNTIPAQSTSCIVATTANAGTYTVTGTDANHCSATSITTISTNALPNITATGNSVCANGCIGITAGGGASYNWVPTTGLSCVTCANPTSCGLTSTLTYTVIGTNASGCSNTATATVNVIPAPTVSASGPTICLGKSTIVCSSVSGGTSPYTYLWSSGGQTTSCITVSPTANTAYPITVTDANGCTGSSNGSVNLFAPVFISAINSLLICNGDSTQLLANASNGPQPYSWSWIPSGSLTNPNTQNPWAHPNTSTNYTVTVTDADGCMADTTVNMTVQTIPNGSFNWVTGKISCDGITLDFRDNLSTNTVSGLWSFGDGSTDTSIFNHDPNYTPYSPLPHPYPFNGTYTVTLTTNNGPCHTNKDTVLTIPDVSKLIAIKAANVFTPDNGDALNNCFHPAFCDLSNTTSTCPQDSLTDLFQNCTDLEVYDRWGIKVFESTDTQKCWDGTTKSGAKAKEGTYYYIAKFKDTVLKGYVELMR